MPTRTGSLVVTTTAAVLVFTTALY